MKCESQLPCGNEAKIVDHQIDILDSPADIHYCLECWGNFPTYKEGPDGRVWWEQIK